MTTTTAKTWGQMSTYEQVASDYTRALAETRTSRERDEVMGARRAVLSSATPAATRARAYLPAPAPTTPAPTTPAPAAPVARVRYVGPMRTCSYCDRRVPMSAMCCGDAM